MRKLLIIAIILFSICSLTFASDTGGAFSPLILNARAAGMGEAYVAVSDDLGALIYNPAGLIYVPEKVFGFNHLQIPEGFTRVEFIGGNINLNTISIGLGFQTKGITNSEELLFPFSESALQLSIAKSINPNLTIGSTLYLYLATLDTGNGTGFGMDLGLLYNLNPNIKIGAVLYNPISFISWSTGTTESAGRQDLVLGSSFKFQLANIPILFAFDFSLFDKMYFYQRIRLGLEFNVPNTPLSLRTGYNGEKNSLSMGIGLKIQKFQFDYAFLYTKDLSNQHVIGLALEF